jgi:hypothetical protein
MNGGQRWHRWATAAAIAALAAWAFWHRFRFSSLTPYPVGIDGYFYPIQLRSLLETGGLAYPSSPLALWLMAPLAALTDPIVGAKLGAALGTAVLVVPVYFLGRRLARGDRAVGLLAAVLVATSAESFYLSTEFVKNGISLTIAAAYLVALARAIESPTRLRIGVAVGALAGTALAHKTAFGFAVLASIVPIWLASRRRALQIGAAAVGLALVAGIVAPDRFVALADLSMLGRMFTADADWTLPALHLPGFALHFDYEVAVAGVLGVAALAIWIARDRRDRDANAALVVGPAALAVVAAIPWLDTADHQGLAFRLRLLSFLPLALCGAYVAGTALRAGDSLWRTLVPESPALAPAVLAIGFALGLIAARPAESDEGVLRVHPAMQAAVRGVKVPDGATVIIPERHILYMVKWYTRTPARLAPDGVDPALRWRLLPGAHLDRPIRQVIDRARVEPVPGAAPRSLHSGDRNGLVLIDEATWQWIVAQLPPASRERYESWPTI